MHALHASFARFGPLQAQSMDQWQGDVALPPALATFYAQIGPWGETVHAHVGPVGIDIPGLNVCFPPLPRLWALQAGYRWEGNDGKRLTDWPARWLVIAEQNADPFILDGDSGQVLFAFHGAGRWDATVLTEDLPTFLAALAAVGTVYLDAGDDLEDDDGELRPAHRQAAVRAVAAVLGGDEAAEDFFDILEW
ncbi:SUKH-4 family immunity protein [Bacillus subtilis subsp. subtilis]|nr:SUKH-4 family immunity protein [Bacillus subtilis subsp. subtilis]